MQTSTLLHAERRAAATQTTPEAVHVDELLKLRGFTSGWRSARGKLLNHKFGTIGQ